MYRRRYKRLADHRCHDVTKGNRKKHCFLDFDYLQTTIISQGIQAVLKQVSEARKASPNDEDLQTVAEALQLSQGALHVDPRQLASQLLSRIPLDSGQVCSLLHQSSQKAGLHLTVRHRSPVLIPIGGPLINCIYVTRNRIQTTRGLAMTSDGQRVITTTGEELVVVDVMESVTQHIKAQRVYDVSLHLGCDDSIVILNNRKSLQAFNLQTGEHLWTIEDNISYSTMTCCAGPKRHSLVVFHEDYVMLYDVMSGDHTGTIRIPDSAEYRFCLGWIFPVGNERYVVTTDKACKEVVVVDVVEQIILCARTLRPLGTSAADSNSEDTKGAPDTACLQEEEGVKDKDTILDPNNGNNNVLNNDAKQEEDEEEEGNDEEDGGDIEEENRDEEEEGEDDDEDGDEGEEDSGGEEEDSDDEEEDSDGEEEDCDVEEEEDDEEEDIYEKLTVDGLCLTSDGQVVCVTGETGHPFILNISTLDTVKVYEGPEVERGALTYKTTPDGRYMYYCGVDSTITVWDLQNGQYWATLPKSGAREVATVDGRRFVTLSESSHVRVWDTARQSESDVDSEDFHVKQAKVINADQAASYTRVRTRIVRHNSRRIRASLAKQKKKKMFQDSPAFIAMCLTLSSPRYVLLVVMDKGQYYLHLYDVALDVVIRKASMGPLGSRKHLRMCHVDGSRVVFTVGTRHKMVDIDKMEVTLTFQGQFYPELQSSPIFLQRSSELLTVTKAGHHLKAYNVEMGLVSRILHQQGRGDKPSLSVCRRLLVNETQTLAAFRGFFGPVQQILVFDLSSSKMLCAIDNEVVSPDYSLDFNYMIESITDEDLILIHGFCRKDVARSKEEVSTEDGKECLIIFDAYQRRIVQHLEAREGDPKLLFGTRFDSCFLLTQSRLMVGYEELVRIYNLHTGEAEQTIEDDYMGIDWYRKDSCPIMVSKDTVTHSLCFQVWSKRDLTPLASFFPDEIFSQLTGKVILLPGHGADFLALRGTGDTPVLFHLQGNEVNTSLGNQPSLGDHTMLFLGEQVDLILVNFTTDEGKDDLNDPDDDDK